MKVHINLSKEYTEPQITILAAEANDDIQNLLSYIQNMEKIIAANEGDSIIILKPEEIYMICSMGRGVKIYSENKEYTSSKCLYEFENILGNHFVRISKTTLINLSQLKKIEPSFNGMLVVLKNGKSDYISRKYLPLFKKRLGL